MIGQQQLTISNQWYPVVIYDRKPSTCWDCGNELLPRGPAHVTLGEFSCTSRDEPLGGCGNMWKPVEPLRYGEDGGSDDYGKKHVGFRDSPSFSKPHTTFNLSGERMFMGASCDRWNCCEAQTFNRNGWASASPPLLFAMISDRWACWHCTN